MTLFQCKDSDNNSLSKYIDKIKVIYPNMELSDEAIMYWLELAACEVNWAKRCDVFDKAILIQTQLLIKASGTGQSECFINAAGAVTGHSFAGESITYANTDNTLSMQDILDRMKLKCAGSMRSTFSGNLKINDDCCCG